MHFLKYKSNLKVSLRPVSSRKKFVKSYLYTRAGKCRCIRLCRPRMRRADTD